MVYDKIRNLKNNINLDHLQDLIIIEDPFLVLLHDNPFQEKLDKIEAELLRFYRKTISRETLKDLEIQRMQELEETLGS